MAGTACKECTFSFLPVVSRKQAFPVFKCIPYISSHLLIDIYLIENYNRLIAITQQIYCTSVISYINTQFTNDINFERKENNLQLL